MIQDNYQSQKPCEALNYAEIVTFKGQTVIVRHSERRSKIFNDPTPARSQAFNRSFFGIHCRRSFNGVLMNRMISPPSDEGRRVIATRINSEEHLSRDGHYIRQAQTSGNTSNPEGGRVLKAVFAKSLFASPEVVLPLVIQSPESSISHYR